MKNFLFAQPARRRQQGSVIVLFAILIPILIGFAALAVDLGYVQYAKARLQSSTDAAALAGGRDINCCANSTAIASAIEYSSVAGGRNEIANLTVEMSSGYPKMMCLDSIKTTLSCNGYDASNAIIVTQSTQVPLFFGRILGRDYADITATAISSAAGGTSPPLNVMIVLDTTASMNNSNTSCGSGNTRLTCALKGIRSFLPKLNNPKNKVGLAIFPPLRDAAQIPYEYDCKSSTAPAIASSYYQAGLQYVIVPPGSGYLQSGSTALNPTSNLVKAVGGVAGCPSMVAVGGVGTYYADAIRAAEAALPVNENQNVIILVSDGDASSTKMTALLKPQQCAQAVTASASSTAAGTWVYSLAYGAAISGCSLDTSPKISPCDAMKAIASKPSMYFSDSTGQCAGTTGNVVDLFSQVGNSLTIPRLLPRHAL